MIDPPLLVDGPVAGGVALVALALGIVVARRAVATVPDSDPDRGMCLSNLAPQLRALAERTGAVAGLIAAALDPEAALLHTLVRTLGGG